MLAVLITLTPGRWNEFIDYQTAKLSMPVLSIMEVRIRWNSTLELFERISSLWEFTHKSLQNTKYCDYWVLFTTQDELTIDKYVMEVFRPFRFWTRWRLKRHMVTLHHVITVYNDMFDYMDDVMWALAKKKTEWKEDLFFAVKLAQQTMSR